MTPYFSHRLHAVQSASVYHFSSVQVWIKDSLKEGSYKTVIAALVFSVPAVSDAIQKMDSYKKTLQGGFERTYQLVTG